MMAISLTASKVASDLAVSPGSASIRLKIWFDQFVDGGAQPEAFRR